eukprot:1042057-Alexandrium_andersonii.AAC.1
MPMEAVSALWLSPASSHACCPKATNCFCRDWTYPNRSPFAALANAVRKTFRFSAVKATPEARCDARTSSR